VIAVIDTNVVIPARGPSHPAVFIREVLDVEG
jgi:hypothetical protein